MPRKKSPKKDQQDAMSLDDLESLYDGAEAGSFEKVPKGTYDIIVEGAKLQQATSSGRWQVGFEFVVVNGEFVNRTIYEFQGIDNKVGMSILLARLELFGIEKPKNLKKGIPAALEAIQGCYARLTNTADTAPEDEAKEPADFYKLRFKKALDPEEVEDERDADSNSTSPGLVEGNACEALWEDDGNYYPGTIVSVDDEARTAEIKFDDGNEATVEFANINIEETDEGADPGDSESEPHVEIAFTEEDLTQEDCTAITELCEKENITYNPDDYDEWMPLISDIATVLDIDGVFNDSGALIKACQEAADE